IAPQTVRRKGASAEPLSVLPLSARRGRGRVGRKKAESTTQRLSISFAIIEAGKDKRRDKNKNQETIASAINSHPTRVRMLGSQEAGTHKPTSTTYCRNEAVCLTEPATRA